MTMLKQIIQRNNVASRQVLLACDGLTALQQAQSQNPVNLNGAHYDLIGTIQTIRDKLPNKITFEHVKGHQDDGCIAALTQLATMNIEMDEIAKKAVEPSTLRPTRYQVSGEPWVCYMSVKKHAMCQV